LRQQRTACRRNRRAARQLDGRIDSALQRLFRFGYLWWLHGPGTYRANGFFGQGICINPGEQVVIALQSARDMADKPEDWALQFGLYDALTDTLRE